MDAKLLVINFDTIIETCTELFDLYLQFWNSAFKKKKTCKAQLQYDQL